MSQRANDYLEEVIRNQGINMGSDRPVKAAVVEFILHIGVKRSEDINRLENKDPAHIICLQRLRVGWQQYDSAFYHHWQAQNPEDENY